MKQMNGLITALITPFKEGKIDFGSLEKLIKHQIDRGVSGFVVNGTTGESPTLSDIEVQSLFKFCQKVIPKACPSNIGDRYKLDSNNYRKNENGGRTRC
jgi:4-hydroxy-tetrahydrodipicolinate synthase